MDITGRTFINLASTILKRIELHVKYSGNTIYVANQNIFDYLKCLQDMGLVTRYFTKIKGNHLSVSFTVKYSGKITTMEWEVPTPTAKTRKIGLEWPGKESPEQAYDRAMKGII